MNQNAGYQTLTGLLSPRQFFLVVVKRLLYSSMIPQEIAHIHTQLCAHVQQRHQTGTFDLVAPVKLELAKLHKHAQALYVADLAAVLQVNQ